MSSSPTDGDGYAQWFERQNKITGTKLVKVVRLMKYVRDSREEFKAKPILLTTLLAAQIYTTDSAGLYEDLPTAFLRIINRLDAFLQANPTMPIVKNPASPQEENFNRHWNQSQYN